MCYRSRASSALHSRGRTSCSSNMDHLVNKPRSKSHVWLYFGLKADEHGQPLNSGEAVCRLCRKVVLAKSGNTTNLRSHLQRRHALDFPNTATVTAPSTAAIIDNQSSDLNNEDFFEDTPLLQAIADPSAYVADAALPPGDPWLSGGPSRAALSLPSFLSLCDDACSSESKVFAKCQLQQGIMFGPFVGEICRGQMPASFKYSWAIRDDSSFFYVDATNENKSNWMRYVRYTSCEEVHNLAVFQFYRHIYYRVSRPVSEGAELRVWIGKDYASLLGLGISDDGVRCEIGEKETALNQLQDIQVVTLPKPSSTSSWPDNSQSQSPVPVFCEATAVSNSSEAGTAFQISVRGSHPIERYDCLPGTEKLLGSVSPFFGLEPDSSGKPADPNTAVCKLCMERVACGDIQSHLMHRHDIRPPDSSKDRTVTKGQQRVPHVGYSATAQSSSMTDAITNFLITDLLPLALVEGEGFKQMIHTLLPSYRQLPMLPHLDHVLRNSFIRGKQRLAQLLRGSGRSYDASSDVGHSVSLSADVWVYRGQASTERYVTLWAHLIDAHFYAHNLCLGTQRLREAEKGASSLQTLEIQARSMAEEWGITQPLLVLFGGEWRNPTNGNIAAEGERPNSTTEDVVPERSRRSRTFPPVPCFFSTMQHCVEELIALPLVSKSLRHVQVFLYGLLLSRDLDSCFPMGLTSAEKTGLKSWAHGRPTWNQLYLLLNVLVKHKMLFHEERKKTTEDDTASDCSGSSDSQTNALPSQSDWKVLEELCQVLKPLDVACRTLAKDKFPRLSLVKPILTGLLSRHLTTRSDQSSSVLTEAKAMIRGHLTRSYDHPEVSRALSIACSLDPQFHGLTFMEEEDQMATLDWMKEEAVKMANEERRRSFSKRSSSPESTDSNSQRRSKRLKKPASFKYLMDEDEEEEGSGAEPEHGDAAETNSPGGLEFLLGDLIGSAQRSQRSSVEESLDVETSTFHTEKAAPLGVQPCQWWKTKARQFPLLAPAARAFLSAPAAAGNATQEFLGDGTAWKRSNIPLESLDAMLFLHHNPELSTKRSRREKNQ
uniref:Uncharacterized LOC114468642 n=2 Tax=Gouania willdenowi TaxID=441366 RepID=A0A8C5HEJ0_GOUWI